MSNWDHVAFREYVISHARNARLATSQAELARATGIDQGVLSKWFRGLERPSLANLQRLAQSVPGTTVSELAILAGRVSVQELGASSAPAPPRTAHPIAEEVDRLLGEDSTLAAGEREILSTLLHRILAPYRSAPGKQRTA